MFNKIGKKWLALIFCFSIAMGTVSCQLFHDVFDGKVVTTEDNVSAEGKQFMIDAPTELLPQDAKDKLAASGKKIVVVDESFVVEPEKAVKVESPNEGTLGTILDVGLGIANTVWPGVAILEGAGLLLSQRKRQHYSAAVKAVTPYDGNVSVGEAVLSIARGLGIAHSSDTSKVAFEADRKAAE